MSYLGSHIGVEITGLPSWLDGSVKEEEESASVIPSSLLKQFVLKLGLLTNIRNTLREEEVYGRQLISWFSGS